MNTTYFTSKYQKFSLAAALLGLYVLIVRYFRFRRCLRIQSRFKLAGRPLSSMTVKEAHRIVRGLRELEFPYTLHNAMKLSLLKVCFIYIYIYVLTDRD